MDIQFQEYDGSCYALNPRIVRESDHLTIKLDEKSCTHFLVFSCASGSMAELTDTKLQDLLREKADTLLEAECEMLTETLAVRCVNYRDYRIHDFAIEIPNRIAEYTVYGCRVLRQQESETIQVFLPQKQMSNSTSVSITISYQLEYCSGNEGKYTPNRQGVKPYYVVKFEETPDYQDGGIVYTLDNIPFQFPITRAMLGKRLYIDAGMGEPRFRTVVSGLGLKKI